ncbi:hypothetical protein CLV35_3903 [Motilibacter peucedani]|uniref:Magnesium transporter NIPA n=1 Tax=Motilibacter peucedani TaxID=598650 RepID=A0A420XK45_9ACTN|nr:DMT family transporter [Motilibacter peucedani]RKS67996.1 hypothetical protein CLV35_3903 [Motilibacter peucedani]
MPTVVVLGLLAAFLFAAAASLQQHSAHGIARAAGPTSSALPVVTLVHSLVRSRVWLLGWVVNLGGFLSQAAALHLGSVSVVQPLLVTQLLFTLPLASAWARRWPARRDWLAAATVCAGVALFLSVGHRSETDAQPDRAKVLLALATTLVLVTVLVRVAAGRPRARHAFLTSVAAGLCFAQSAVLMKLTATDLLHRGVAATAVDWPGYCLAGSTLLGLLLEQQAFTAGALPLAISAMTITNPAASYLVGVLAFDVSLPDSPGALATLSASGLLLVVGVVGLAHSPYSRAGATAAVPVSR